MADRPVVVGVDAGGTHVRALACTDTGERLGTGRSGGANPTSRGLRDAGTRIGEALEEALADLDPRAVTRIVIGAAGSLAQGPELSAELESVWTRLGLQCERRLRSDLEVAFAAGRPEPDGIVVLAGTGAAVATIRSGTLQRCLDGAGWLLGDIGSGFWMGREAVRAVLAAIDGTGPATALTRPVAEALGAEPGKWEIVGAVYGREPVRLAELAPAVAQAADDGDTVALGIVEQAAATLLTEADVLLQEGPPVTAAVLAGGVLLAGGILTDRISMALTTRYGLAIGTAHDGAAGAAWLALTAGGAADPGVHQRLTRSARS